jgi:hypothetical protein
MIALRCEKANSPAVRTPIPARPESATTRIQNRMSRAELRNESSARSYLERTLCTRQAAPGRPPLRDVQGGQEAADAARTAKRFAGVVSGMVEIFPPFLALRPSFGPTISGCRYSTACENFLAMRARSSSRSRRAATPPSRHLPKRRGNCEVA